MGIDADEATFEPQTGLLAVTARHHSRALISCSECVGPSEWAYYCKTVTHGSLLISKLILFKL